VREGFLGAASACSPGVVGCILLDQFGPFANIPWFVYVALCGVATLFGAWEGGLIGVEKKNKKIERFSEDIEPASTSFLSTRAGTRNRWSGHMMSRRHPEAEFAGVDRQFVNPFTSVRRRRNPAIGFALNKGAPRWRWQ
jgi:hypothetical protein